MSSFDWKMTQFEERWFHVLACLLARKDQQQEAHTTGHIDEAELDQTSDSLTDDEDGTETTSPRKIAGRLGVTTLKEKFLDRLAEVMAREIKHNEKSGDVCATGTLDFENRTVVYVARNDGLLDHHKRMMRIIQMWLRAVAITGERRAILDDKMWSELVTWSLPRLEYWKDRLRSNFTIFHGLLLESPSSDIFSKLKALQMLCTLDQTVAPSNIILAWTDIITLCFELRYHTSLFPALEARLDTPKAKVMWRNIAMMGRLRKFAMQFMGAKLVELCSVEAPVLRTLQAFKNAEISGYLTSLGINLDNLVIKMNKKRVKTRARKLEILKADLEKQVRVHAETQILMQLVDAENDKKSCLKEFDYIGCSKKSCYLCWHLLNGFYRTRGSHGKVYPLWTISSPALLNNWPCFKLHSRVLNMGEAMIEQLRSPARYKIPHVAESTAGMTTASVPKASHRYRSVLDKQRAQSQKKGSLVVKESPFGHELKKIRVFRLPGDGADPSIVNVPIREITKAYLSKDSMASDVPDFGRFWEGQLNFDRGYQSMTATNQGDIEPYFDALNGQYLLYFNVSEELLPNEYLRKKVVDGIIPNERKFWNGDVFVVKLATRWIEITDAVNPKIKKEIEVEYDEKSHTMYEDIPDCILKSPLTVNSFRKMWEDETREDWQRRHQEAERSLNDLENDKRIILSRMTETEKKVLELLPPNFIEILTIESRDYGAMTNPKIEEDPTNPEYVMISYDRKIDTLKKINWEGFSSKQL